MRSTALQAIAHSCYALLANQLGARLPTPTSLVETIKEAFAGDGITGLILLPGRGQRQWWPPSRVIHEDRSPMAGPYLGYLHSRYRDAMPLWQALGIRRDLSPSLIADLIRESLARDREHRREDVADWYGELVAQLEKFDLENEPRPKRRVPAYTQNGWIAPSSACWTDRPDMEAAFQDSLNWWRPGARDASALRRAAAWLGIRRLGSSAWPVQEQWKGQASEPVDSGLQQRWQWAMQVWRVRVRSLPEGGRAAADDIWNDLLRLRPECAPYLECRFATTLRGGNEIKAKADRIMYIDRRRHRFLASSVKALFSREAAAVLAAHIPVPRLPALDSLAAILGQAFTDPEGFQREVERYLGVVTSHYGSSEAASRAPSEPEGEPSRQEINAAIKNLKKPLAPAPMPKPSSPTSQSAPSPQHGHPLADATRFTVDRLVEFDGKIDEQFRRNQLPLRKPKTGGGGWRPPSGPTLRYRNNDIEAAAFNLVALVEWERDGLELTRQGPADVPRPPHILPLSSPLSLPAQTC